MFCKKKNTRLLFATRFGKKIKLLNKFINYIINPILKNISEIILLTSTMKIALLKHADCKQITKNTSVYILFDKYIFFTVAQTAFLLNVKNENRFNQI